MTALRFLLDRVDELPATRALVAQLPPPGGRLAIGGLPGSSAVVLVAALAQRLPQRVVVVVTSTSADAERWLADSQTLLGPVTALYPQREGLGAEEPHLEIAGERIETVEALLSGAVRVLITTARASGERTGVPTALRSKRLDLDVGHVGDDAGGNSLSDVVRRLGEMGYTRVPTVTEVGQFSVHGGIIDVYGFGMATPARLEWSGDEIASLRSFDLDTQRSGDAVKRVTVLPLKTEEGMRVGLADARGGGGTARSSLFQLLPSDALLLLEDEPAIEREVVRAWEDAAHHLEVARRLGKRLPGVTRCGSNRRSGGPRSPGLRACR